MTPLTPLRVSAQAHGTFTVIALCGELDPWGLGEAESQVRRAVAERGPHLVLDLSELTFCDSMGLRLFLKIHAYTTGRDGSAALAALQPQVRRLLDITGLAARLRVFTSVAEALQD